MKYTLSARNQFEGTVKSINEGAVNGIVTLDVNGSDGCNQGHFGDDRKVASCSGRGAD